MIPKKPAPDLIRGGRRFSKKIMLKQKVLFVYRIFCGEPLHTSPENAQAAVELP
jgi:hypothetical protein